jgi:hypothetical protein
MLRAVEALKYIREIGCQWDEKAVAVAKEGQFTTLNLLRENDCPVGDLNAS